MFGVVPKSLWSRTNPADADNRIALAARILVVDNQRAGYRAVVDVGLGDAWSDKERDRFQLDRASLERVLASHNVDPDSVTDIVLTHLHWDHAGGLATRTIPEDHSSPLRRAIPRARLHVGSAHLDYAHRATAKDRASFRAFELAQASTADVRRMHAGDVLPGLCAIRFDGHTEGLLAIEASGAGVTVLFPADVLPMRPHVRPGWGMGYDNHPLTLLDEKTAMLARCEANDTRIVLEHDPDACAIVVRHGVDGWTSDLAPDLTDTPTHHG